MLAASDPPNTLPMLPVRDRDIWVGAPGGLRLKTHVHGSPATSTANLLSPSSITLPCRWPGLHVLQSYATLSKVTVTGSSTSGAAAAEEDEAVVLDGSVMMDCRLAIVAIVAMLLLADFLREGLWSLTPILNTRPSRVTGAIPANKQLATLLFEATILPVGTPFSSKTRARTRTMRLPSCVTSEQAGILSSDVSTKQSIFK